MSEKGGRTPTKQQLFEQSDRVFRASGNGLADVEALLTECRDIADDEFQETFALVFRLSPDVPPIQGTYVLQNEKIGALDLFLVPIRADEKGLYLEALFNRLKEREEKEVANEQT